ncbi:TonB-dependent receptor plug domain-containing protein [Pontibacter sp. HSC-14F20]|uniref:TonB-dependent receptor plug domain-containing protein n=1 Tax=Pontibacter sp. HSC-14F20 TaxID=2864136 RepID=UPI001C733421|nr:TonB-dependent receptor plug domain-containing protein [Pontibacter sp. HSC-14F20]MBX0335422.1 TonB-dependent receptor plug domain-containing protein [Pontibacter sp. HSC-14F20]
MTEDKSTIKWAYLLPVLLLAFVSLAFVSPQTDLLQKLETHLASWRTTYAPEKVYIHLDKPRYTPGQQIWLKGYVVDAASLQPTAKSSVLYVDLLNANNEAVQHLKLKAENGKANGDIILPANLPVGQYTLTGYTQWMRNYGEENFFRKEISIIGEKAAAEKQAKTTQRIDLQFFPEGGDLLQGMQSRVAFKATKPDGTGTAVTGAVYDAQNQKLFDFKDTHLGMGAFALQPQQGQRYTARVTFEDGSKAEYTLPEAKSAGFVLSVNETANPDQLQVNVTGNASGQQSLVLTGISRDAVQYAEQINLQAGQTFSKQIAKADFPTGIARFNLAKSNGEPLAERLVFIDRQDNLNISLTTDKKTYAGRERVTMQVLARDKQGNPVSTDFSLAITDDELVTPELQGLNINAYLLLTSDLRGYVQNPAYYFEKDDATRQEALSYLLMTQGWRRFGWQQLAKGRFPALKHSPETDLAVRGTLLTDRGKPVKGGEALLYLKGQHLAFITTETDKDGRFAFEGFDFTGPIDMVVQGTDARGRRKHLQVQIDEQDFQPKFPAIPVPQTSELVASASPDLLTASKVEMAAADEVNTELTLKGILLKDVEIQGEADMVQPFKLHREADAVIDVKELPVAPSGNVIESLQGRVAGVQVYRAGPGDFRVRIRGSNTAPLYLIDGLPVKEGFTSHMNQFNISRIEILKGPASASLYGGRASGGVIALYTRQGNEAMQEVEPGKYIIIHRAQGYSKVREFYSPTYDGKSPTSREPDLRTTLYWNPNVQTDAAGKATVSFYAADRNTTYRAIMEGISDAGRPGRGITTFDVSLGRANP